MLSEDTSNLIYGFSEKGYNIFVGRKVFFQPESYVELFMEYIRHLTNLYIPEGITIWIGKRGEDDNKTMFVPAFKVVDYRIFPYDKYDNIDYVLNTLISEVWIPDVTTVPENYINLLKEMINRTDIPVLWGKWYGAGWFAEVLTKWKQLVRYIGLDVDTYLSILKELHDKDKRFYFIFTFIAVLGDKDLVYEEGISDQSYDVYIYYAEDNFENILSKVRTESRYLGFDLVNGLLEELVCDHEFGKVVPYVCLRYYIEGKDTLPSKWNKRWFSA